MVATPRYATMILVPQAGGLTKHIDCYFSDVAAALARFDQGSGSSASSIEKYTMPFPGFIVDLVFQGDTADCDAFQLVLNGAPTGDWFRFANHLATDERAAMRIPINKGVEIGFIQRA